LAHGIVPKDFVGSVPLGDKTYVMIFDKKKAFSEVALNLDCPSQQGVFRPVSKALPSPLPPSCCTTCIATRGGQGGEALQASIVENVATNNE